MLTYAYRIYSSGLLTGVFLYSKDSETVIFGFNILLVIGLFFLLVWAFESALREMLLGLVFLQNSGNSKNIQKVGDNILDNLILYTLMPLALILLSRLLGLYEFDENAPNCGMRGEFC